MKVTMIGSHLCQNTLYALIKLKEHNVTIDFQDVAASFPALREYIHVRETSPVFEAYRKTGDIMMPYIKMEDGTETLHFEDVLKKL
jgi:glutaredoxin-related protein